MTAVGGDRRVDSGRLGIRAVLRILYGSRHRPTVQPPSGKSCPTCRQNNQPRAELASQISCRRADQPTCCYSFHLRNNESKLERLAGCRDWNKSRSDLLHVHPRMAPSRRHEAAQPGGGRIPALDKRWRTDLAHCWHHSSLPAQILVRQAHFGWRHSPRHVLPGILQRCWMDLPCLDHRMRPLGTQP